MQRWGYSLEPQVGPLWKSTSGEFSNLRWDIQPNQVPFYWQQVRPRLRRIWGRAGSGPPLPLVCFRPGSVHVIPVGGARL
jgi:hypothetical protein